MASVYCLTIVVVLTIAAAVLLSFLRWLSTTPVMNIGLGLLFIYDAVKLTHRIVGPLYRFRKTIQAVTAGEEIIAQEAAKTS